MGLRSPPVYVCLYVDSDDVAGGPVDPNELVPRRVGEAIGSTVGTLATIVNYPIGIISIYVFSLVLRCNSCLPML